MRYSRDFSEYTPWEGAVDTMDKIEAAGMRDRLESFLEEVVFPGRIPEESEINDLLWFDSDWVLDALGISEEE